MKVLMFGWEFPPFNSGGLGTACYGLTKALSKEGIQITFVVPKLNKHNHEFLNLIAADIANIQIKGVTTLLQGYISFEEYTKTYKKIVGKTDPAFTLYGKNLIEEVERYAKKAAIIASQTDHDVIHAHDWLTFKAGVEAKKVSGRPLVVHVHATEFDRGGGNGVNQQVYDIENLGINAADAVISVSNYTKTKIVKHYNVSPDKVHVVHNSIDFDNINYTWPSRRQKTVLYLGRITLQKGPDYFIEAARKVLDVEPDTKFIIAGAGDMENAIKSRCDQLGITDNILFTGFLREEDIRHAYKMASLYVMPSVSEPFGLTPLEAASTNTPALISKQSGVSEVFSNCLKVDFWDIDQMANKIVSVLRYPELQESLAENALTEVTKMNWSEPAIKCIQLYSQVINTKYN